jgi:hypothetical protein
MKNFVYGSVGVLIGSGVCLGGIIASGVATGLFSSLGVGMILYKLKDSCPRLWAWILKHYIFSDLVLSILLAYLVGSGTAVGIIAGSASALFVSAGITYLGSVSRSLVKQ